MSQIHCENPNWLAYTLDSLESLGYCLIKGVFDQAFVSQAKSAAYNAQKGAYQLINQERRTRAGEVGVVRLPMTFDSFFFKFLEQPQILSIVDATVSKTAILHLQNAFILPPAETNTSSQFQFNFHQDFPRTLNGYLASINILVTLDEFTEQNGGTLVVPNTHQRSKPPALDFMNDNAMPIECPSGTLIVFDSTLWHAAGKNYSQLDRIAVNHQFTRSFFKQQFDYIRAIDSRTLKKLPSRSQQLLGAYTQVVTNLDEYYRPNEERLYRAEQG